MLIPPQRHLFDIPDDVAYLNCAYMSPLMHPVVEAGRAGIARKARPWTIVRDDFFTESDRARALFAQPDQWSRGLRGSDPGGQLRHRRGGGATCRWRAARRSWCWRSSSRPTSTHGASSPRSAARASSTVDDGQRAAQRARAGAHRAAHGGGGAAPLPLDRRRAAGSGGHRRALPRGGRGAGARRHPVGRRPAAGRGAGAAGLPGGRLLQVAAGALLPGFHARGAALARGPCAGALVDRARRQRRLLRPGGLPRRLPAGRAAIRHGRAGELPPHAHGGGGARPAAGLGRGEHRRRRWPNAPATWPLAVPRSG